jgi:hypothetical protein
VIVAGAAVAAANNTDSNSTRIDMTGWDGIVFIAPIDDSTATGTVKLTVESNTADSDTGMTALTGATYTATSAINDDLNSKAIVVDVYRPLKRYVQGVRVSATQNGAFGDLIAILYRGKSLPFTMSTTLLGKVAVAGPADV